MDLVVDALHILGPHPRTGRPLEFALRELAISRGKTACQALYAYDEPGDMVIVPALCHEREQDYC